MSIQRKKTNLNPFMKSIRIFKPLCLILAGFFFLGGSLILFKTSAQTEKPFDVGERLTYNVSFEKFENAAYAEMYVVSRGKLDGKESVELSAKIKTVDLVSAAFYLFDEARSTFVSESTGLPMYIRSVSNTSGLPKEKISNFLGSPSLHYDLLSVIYKARNSGGAGSFSVLENEQIYNFDFAPLGGEIVKTDAGEFDTIISGVQSTYFNELGITNLKINFTGDERRIPVLIRFTTEKGGFTAKIASIQNLEPVVTPTAAVTVTPVVVPPTRTPTPVVTPTPYIDNQPLSPELPFDLGETLEFQVTSGPQDFGKVVLQAKERREFNDEDSLLLTAGVSEIGAGNPLFNLQDRIETQVDPFTLTPRQVEIDLKGSFSLFNQIADFDQELGLVEFDGGNQVNVPVGTHSLLSLAFAIRNFNLKPSLDSDNPVNDTRVAIFLGSKPYVLTLRPTNATIKNSEGKDVPALLVSIQTGNPSIDRLNLRLWLSNDRQRLPLRFIVGTYQADLISNKVIAPK
jgi:hypothetical protein